jgi:O-antigen/teichoic acid export membrane protein
VVTIVIARVLGPSGKGAYSLILLVSTLLFILGNLGINISNVYFGGKQKYSWAEIASNSLILALALGFSIATAFLTYFFVFQPSFLKGLEPRCIVLATLVLPFNFLSMYFSYILLGQNRIMDFNLVGLLSSCTLLALIFLILFAFKGEVFGAILAAAGAALITAIVCILLVRRVTKITWSFSPALFKDSLKFGVKGYLGNVIQFLNYRLDMLLVNFFLSVAFVGYYTVAVSFAEALWYFPGAVGTVIFARTPGISTEEANRSTPKVYRNTLFLTILAAVALFILSKSVVLLLFGPAFLPAIQPLKILLPGVVALGSTKVLTNEIAGRGRPIINTIAAGVSLIINISLNILLIPTMGISGAALASTISYSVTSVIVFIAFIRISHNSIFDTLIIKPRDLRVYAQLLTKGRKLAFQE